MENRPSNTIPAVLGKLEAAAVFTTYFALTTWPFRFFGLMVGDAQNSMKCHKTYTDQCLTAFSATKHTLINARNKSGRRAIKDIVTGTSSQRKIELPYT